MIGEQRAQDGVRGPRHDSGAQPWWRDDRGAGTLEYQGILVVAALLIGAVVGTTVLFPEHAQTAACQIVSAFEGGGDCASDPTADAPPTDEDLRPGVCMLSETSKGGGVGVDIGFVTLGGDWGLQVTEYSNDEVHATVTNAASAGVKAEIEGEVGVAGVDASASIEGQYEHGDTWIVPKEDWPEFEANARDYFSQSKFRWLGAGNLWGASEPRSPDVTSHQGGAQMEVGAGAKVGVDNMSDDPKRGGNITAASASASASGSASVKRETNSKDDTVTWTFAIDGEASAEAGVVVAGAGAQVSRAGSLSVEYDAAQMKVQSLSFQTVARGGAYAALGLEVEISNQPGGRHSKPSTDKQTPSMSGEADSNDVVVTTTTLEVTPENRAFVEAWLAERSDGWGASLPLEPVIPTAPSDDDEMMQELYENGKTSRTVYEATDTSGGMGFGVSAGVGAGIDISGTEGERNVSTAEFLGSPRENGERPFLPNSQCE